MKNKSTYQWRKVQTSYYDLISKYGISVIDVCKYNKKTGFVTWIR